MADTDAARSKPEEAAVEQEVRLIDGYEFGECFIWLSLSDELPLDLDVAKFKVALDTVAAPYAAFHLGTVVPKWVRVARPPSAFVREEPWHDRAPVKPMVPFAPEGSRMWFVVVSKRPQADEETEAPVTRVTLHASHGLCDGRSIGTMFAVVLHAVLGSLGTLEAVDALKEKAPALKKLPPLPAPCDLCPFGQVDHFVEGSIPTEALTGGVPASWRRARPMDSVLPRITMPDNYQARYSEYPAAAWRAYAARGETRPSLQGAMMAAQTRGFRTYCKMGREEPVIAEVMYDTRQTSYATPEYRSRAFFCNAGAGFIEVCGQESWDADIAYCTEELRKNAALPDSAAMVLQMGAALDPKTGQFKTPEGMPSSFRTNVVVTTNIGRYDGTTVPRVEVRVACAENYYVCQYIWSSADTIHVMYLAPSTLDPAYVGSLSAATDELFKHLASTTSS